MKFFKSFTVINSIHRFFLIIIGILLLLEIINTAILGLFSDMSSWSQILLSVFLNSLFLSPIFYLLVFRPWTKHLAERIQAERALQEKEIKYRSFIDQSHEGFILTDEKGKIIIWNTGMVTITGIAQDEAIGMPVWEIQSWLIPQEQVTQKLLDQIQNRLKDILESKMEWTGEVREQIIQCPDRTRKTISESSFLVKNGDVVSFGAIIRDITHEKKSEEELKASERKYRFMFENNPQPMCIFDLEKFSVLEVNKAMIDHYGYSKEEFLSMTILDFQPAEDIPVMLDHLERTTRNDKNFIPKAHWRHIKKNGEIIVVEIISHPVIYNGRMARHVLINDVSEKKKAEDKLRESESETRALISAIPDLIFTNHRNGEYLSVHVSDPELLFVKPEDFLHRSIDEVMPKPLAQQFLKIFVNVLDLRTPQVHNYILSLNGNEKYFEARVVPYTKDAVISIVRDVTERKQIEEALRESEERYRTVVSKAPVVIFTIDDKGIFTLSEGLGLAKLGLQPGQVVGQSVFDVYRDYPSIIEANKKALAGQRLRSEFEVEGTVFDVYYSPVFDQNEKVIKVVGVATDITERKRAEEALYQAQKIKSIGLLSSGIAHDFNNLLNIMMGNISLAAKKISTDHQAVKFLDRSLLAMERAANLTKQILAYSGKGRFQILTIDLITMIRDHRNLFETVIPKNAELQINLLNDEVHIKGDPGQIEQIFMNLITNSAEAIGEKQGLITVSVSIVPMTDKELLEYSAISNSILEEKSYVLLQVSDNGCGMNKETMEKMFDPFFTTKFVGRGLGLSAVLGIIRGHKGGIAVDSVEGVGTTFHVLLPLVDVPVLTKEALPENKFKHSSEQATILVIDDEEHVADMICDILELGQYHRRSATDPVVGIQLYEEQWRKIDLVILDYSMPKMNGRDVIIALRKINPNVKVIISSGYSEEDIINLMGIYKPNSFIQKPYSSNVLLSTVSRVLDMK